MGRLCCVILSCALLVCLGFVAYGSLGMTAASAQVSMTPSVWRSTIAHDSTLQAGCYVATYPSEVLQKTQCSTPPSSPMVVGNGHDWTAESLGPTVGETAGAFIASGITNEHVGTQANSYSLQVNSNYGFPLTFFGKSTEGWEQFIFLNRVAPSPSVGQVYVEFWLIGYHSTYGSCPPSSEAPSSSSGWIQDGSDCFVNSDATSTPFMSATRLGDQTMYAFSTSETDQSWFCFSGTCYIDVVFGASSSCNVFSSTLCLYEHWTQTEFNIVGNCCGSRAIFNKGTDIDVSNTLYSYSTGDVMTAKCIKTGTTGETNNLKLGTCSTLTSGNIFFNEYRS